MSLVDAIVGKAEDALVQTVASALSNLPEKALNMVLALVKDASSSPDPVGYIERRIIADSAHVTAQAAVDVALAELADDPPTTVLSGK